MQHDWQRMDVPILPWISQVTQYPLDGPPGISYFAGVTDLGTVDCLLWRDDQGTVRGILNYYSHDFPPYEQAGNFNLFVDPKWKRKGIGTALLNEAMRRWPTISLEQQRYTPEGIAFIDAYCARHLRRIAREVTREVLGGE